MYYVYILRSLTSGRFYTGFTADLKDRLKRHNENRERATRKRGPWELVYYEEYDTRSEAIKREYFLKSPEGGPQKKELVADFPGEKLEEIKGL